jgi:hypothetical protein
MTRDTVVGRKRPVANGIEEILLWSAMRIVTGGTRGRPRLYALMSVDKLRRFGIVAFRTELTACNQGQGSIVRTMRAMADCAIFGCRWVQCTVPPVLCHFAVTIKTKGRLVLIRVAGMG